jgi:hypothetical protein
MTSPKEILILGAILNIVGAIVPDFSSKKIKKKH